MEALGQGVVDKAQIMHAINLTIEGLLPKGCYRVSTGSIVNKPEQYGPQTRVKLGRS